MAPPRVWAPIKEGSLVSEEIIKVFRVTDELDLMQQIIPEQFDLTVTELIERLQVVLARVENPNWGMGLHWMGESDDDVPNRGWA